MYEYIYLYLLPMSTTLNITKDNFIKMIPKMYQFLEKYPKITIAIPNTTDKAQAKFKRAMQRYESGDVIDGSSFI